MLVWNGSRAKPMTDEERRALEAYYAWCKEKPLRAISHETREGFLAGRESLRAERAELELGWRAYEAERARSQKLIDFIKNAIDRGHFEVGGSTDAWAKKLIAEHAEIIRD